MQLETVSLPTPYPNKIKIWWRIFGDDGQLIAQIEPEGDEGKKHAYLFAASPKLLDACAKLLHAFDIMDADLSGWQNGQGVPVGKTIAAARKAGIDALMAARGDE